MFLREKIRKLFVMKNPTKSIIVANDIVGLGKVALSTALPVLSTCQIEVISLPTVLLSSHTGGFDNIAITNLSQSMESFINQWQTLNFHADGLITGYFKSQNQLNLVKNLALKKKLARFVDPIMADNGQLYAGYHDDFVIVMRDFCQNADVITPNITEACLLADIPYLGENYTREDIEQLLLALKKFHNKHVILTGVSFEAGKIGLAHFNLETNQITYHMAPAYPYHFFGTGDLLTAVLGAGYFHGLSLDSVAEVALDFIDKALRLTLDLKRDLKLGICYEPFLLDLAIQMKHLKEEKE